MPKRHRPLNTIFSALLLALIGAAWVVFAPARFGGQAAYVIISGISMEPTFHRGDLVILREANDYAIGDVVTYRHPTIGPVIHRIIGRDGERLIFKGDNNSWIDEYRPRQDELIGRLWIYLPSVGKAVEQLRVPHTMAALVAVMGAIVMSTGTHRLKQPRRREQRGSLLTLRLVVGPRPVQQHTHQVYAAWRDELGFVLATLAFAALLLGLFAFTRAPTRQVAESINYTHTGTWRYAAPAPAGLYDQGDAQTGDPVFRSVSSGIDLAFDYQLSGDQPGALQGSYRLLAELSDVSGWKRTIELRPETPFAGQAVAIDGRLELARVQALIDGFERQVGSPRQQYLLAVVPEIHVHGQLGGQPLDDSFAPKLVFQLDGQVLRLLQDGASGPGALRPSSAGMLKRDRSEPNVLALLGLRLEVLAARRIAGIVLALALAGWLLLVRGKAGGTLDEAARIRRRYGALLVGVRALNPGEGGSIIEVATIDDLARIAERAGQMILHLSNHSYLVCDGEVTYRYQPAAPGAGLEE